MTIKVLVDNHTYIDHYYIGEPAVSYHLTIDGIQLLFDTGYSDILIKNACQMALPFTELSYIVLSHGHNDHTNGLQYLAETMSLADLKLIAHPHCFHPKRANGEIIGAPFSAAQINERTNYVATRSPYQITEHCTFLGEIPRTNAFEPCPPIGQHYVNGQWQPDFLLDDSALVCKTAKGLFIITGCSHSGICNIISYARKVCGDQRIYGVLGGFHLFQTDERLQQTMHYFKSCQLKQLYPCHCVSLAVKSQLMNQFTVTEVGVGLTIDLAAAKPSS